MSEELLPCPHCGGPAERISAVGETWVNCVDVCAGMVGMIEPQRAIAAWNRRSPATDIEKDAARYRWLKKRALIDWVPDDGVALVIPEPEPGKKWKADTDAFIDAAIQAEGSGE